MGSVCIDTLVWKRTRRAQLAKVLGSLCQLGTSVHMQNQFSQPVTVASQEQLQLLVQPPEASHDNLQLEAAPSYDTLWQIWVLKTRVRFWTIGCWGCNFRENTSCQRRLSGTRLLRVWVWLGLGGTFLQSKSCVCWSFLSSGNAVFAKHHI